MCSSVGIAHFAAEREEDEEVRSRATLIFRTVIHLFLTFVFSCLFYRSIHTTGHVTHEPQESNGQKDFV